MFKSAEVKILDIIPLVEHIIPRMEPIWVIKVEDGTCN